MDIYTIREAVTHDIPSIVDLVNSAYRGERSKQGWTTEANILDGVRTDEASLLEILSKANTTILKYVNDKSEIIGCVYLERKTPILYLGMLTVSPHEQTKGIGKQLMKAAEKQAQENNCTVIEMTVITVRNELIAWYERQGYNRTHETRPFPSDTKFGIPKQPLEFVVMQKHLAF